MPSPLVLLNARAGSLIDSGPEGVREEIAQALTARGEAPDIRLLEPRELVPAITKAARGAHDPVIVGGGDGSVSCAVHAFAGSGKTLGVLPFGTLNLLARDLGMPADLHEAVAALRYAKPRTIDLGRINGRAFHSLSGLGFFSQMARAREETRGHPLGRLASVAVAAWRAAWRSGADALDITIDGESESVEALAVLVTVNQFGPDWRRPTLDGGTLELHIAESADVLGKLKASTELLTGSWRESNEGVRSILAREVVIQRRRRHTFAATDGELARERIPLRYAIEPGGLTVLAAASEKAADA